MKAMQLLQARNTISRHKQRLCQELVFVMLVENIAFDKLVEAHWSGEDRVWHTLRAEYHSSDGANREVWRAQASFNPSDDASLPGDIEFALRYRWILTRSATAATQARVRSLDDRQLAQHAGYALLFPQDVLGQVAQEQRPEPESI